MKRKRSSKRADEVSRDPTSPVGGNLAGDVTLLEFFEYNCPYCRRVAPVMIAAEAADAGSPHRLQGISNPIQFEAIAVVELPLATWLVSPLNMLVGFALRSLVDLQLALSRIAWPCARSCGLRPTVGFLAALPALLAGHACCVPALFVLLSVQVTATIIAVMSITIPLALVLMAVGTAITWRYVHRRCKQAYA